MTSSSTSTAATHHRTTTTAVLGDRDGPHATAIAAVLPSQGAGDVKWFTLRDAHDLDAAVERGEIARVMLESWDTYIAALHRGALASPRWTSGEIEVHCADLPPAALLASRTAAAWSAEHRRTRRQRTIAGVVLSAVALAAAFFVTCATNP